MSKRGADIDLLRKALDYLVADGQVPSSFRPHILSGNWSGVWECHISPDWLLLYDLSESVKLVRLIRTGTHSDVFK